MYLHLRLVVVQIGKGEKVGMLFGGRVAKATVESMEASRG